MAIIVIGAGAIVAALITAVQAIAVAAITARTNRAIAIDTAHREHRLSLAKPILDHVRGFTTVAFEIDGATVSDVEADTE